MRSVFLAILLAAAVSAADTARMDQLVRAYVDQGRFNGSVLVARDGDVLFAKGYGFANAEWEVHNAPDTKFRLGSITKQFTAACILLLEEKGKLSTADPVKRHLPDAPAAWDVITIHHLLTHTSGIPNFTSLPEYRTVKLSPTTAEKTYRLFRDKPLDFQPGQKMSYSNSNYLLLGHLIERISGETYTAFLTRNVLEPLGMKDSGYDSRALIPRRAAGYLRTPKGLANADYVDMTIPHAAGALYSTVEDLFKWNRGLYGGKLLTARSLERMTTPGQGNYAYGLVVRDVAGRKVIGHGGGIEGFNTHLDWHPGEQITVAVLANQNTPATAEIASHLASLARGEKVTLPSERPAVSVDPKKLEAYAGTYTLRPGFDLIVTLDSGQLAAQATGQPKAPLFAASETTFFLKVVQAEIEFVAAGGKVTHLILRQSGQTIKGLRK
jgi:CubicO group peptidase (beta-lactamase class C family)